MGKTVYCNCDDPLISNFFKFFYDNFEELGLKNLIATGYAKDGVGRGTLFQYSGTAAQRDQFERGEISYLDGNGDFRSPESLDLLQQADVVVTNPPFSLFRDFVSLMSEFDKQFLIIGNVNAIPTKRFFP